MTFFDAITGFAGVIKAHIHIMDVLGLAINVVTKLARRIFLAAKDRDGIVIACFTYHVGKTRLLDRLDQLAYFIQRDCCGDSRIDVFASPEGLERLLCVHPSLRKDGNSVYI